GLQDIREPLFVLFSKAVGCPFGRRGLQVIQVARAFLEFAHTHADIFENSRSESRSLVRDDGMPVAREIPYHLIHAINADGGKMVAEMRQVALRIRVKPPII